MPDTALTTEAPAGYYPFTVGKFDCVALSDGYVVAPVESLAAEVNSDELRSYLVSRGVAVEGFRQQISCLLVVDRDSGKTVLIDTGLGELPGPGGTPLPTAGKMLANLTAAGVDSEAVETVLISHMHPDHVGGAFYQDGEPVFPNAAFRAGENEAAFWSGESPDLSGQLAPPQMQEVLIMVARSFIELAADRIGTFAAGETVVDGITAVSVPGHTQGQMGFLIQSDGESLLYTGDAMGHPVTSVERPVWRFGFDQDSPTAVATRTRLVQELGGTHQRFFTPHFPWPNLGRIGAVADQAVWMPEAYDWDASARL